MKSVLDWSYEPTCDQTFIQAGVPYLALFLWRIFDSLGVRACSFRALEFREILKGGHLPDMGVSECSAGKQHFWLTIR